MKRSASQVLVMVLLTLSTLACAGSGLPDAQRNPSPTPTRSAPIPAPTITTAAERTDIADLLQHPPAPGERVELDAYFSGAWGWPSTWGPLTGPDRVDCGNARLFLTDKPFIPYMYVLNMTSLNAPPADSPWLKVASPEGTKPGSHLFPHLPYHARLRGYLGEPAFSQCPHAERIMVVEQVVTVYEDKPPQKIPRMEVPAGYESWPRYHDDRFGFSLPHPPDWSVESTTEPDVLTTLVLRSPHQPDYPVTLRVVPDESVKKQFSSWVEYRQGESFGDLSVPTQHLSGFMVSQEVSASEHSAIVVLSASGRAYEFHLKYPVGYEVSQPLLTIYSGIVDGFRLDVEPSPTPTRAIKTQLGKGPFQSQDEALVRARQQRGRELKLVDAQLISEAKARRRARACADFTGHPDGVWLLHVQEQVGASANSLELVLDAATGAQLCAGETSLQRTPYPTARPALTATPIEMSLQTPEHQH